MPRAGSSQLLIHALGPVWHWARVDGEGRVLDSGQCPPQAPNWPANLPIMLLADARATTALSLKLPDLSGARLDQALRWAAEEYLAGAADEEHVVAAGRDAQGLMRCVVIGEAGLRDLLAELAPAVPKLVCPDALCLPWVPGQVSLAAAADSVLMRWGEWAFGSFDEALAAEVLATVAPGEAEPVWYGGEIPAALQGLSLQPFQGGLLSALAPAALKPAVNLMSGPFRSAETSDAQRSWRWVGALAAAVVLVAGAGLLLERQLLRQEATELQLAIDQRFAQSFPGVAPAGRHRELAERELARLRFGQSAGLLDLLHRSAPVVSAQAGLSLEGLSFRDGQLELRVRAADVAALDELERRLRVLDLDAALQSASLDAQGASGRLRISEGRG
ncbi:MAG: type II secretion system protein GspL [Wenzhouxiangella sp.]